MAVVKTNSPVTYRSAHQRLLLQIQSHPLGPIIVSLNPSLLLHYSNFIIVPQKKESQIPCSDLLCPLSFPSMNCQLSYFAPRPLRTASMMAIRTKTPLVICSTIRDFGASTKWSAISTSRFTGAGCIKIAVSFIRS